MLAKLLKRKESRQSVVESTTTTENGQQQQQPPLLQYRYQRPDLIGKLSEGEQNANANHGVRPVVLPKSKLIVESIGYAEAINAGKSRYNEDQACIFQGQLRPKSDLGNYSQKKTKPINYLYFGLFDGHGGPGCAVKASKELQQIVHEGLDDALDYIVRAHKVEIEAQTNGKNRRNSLAPKVHGIEDEDKINGGIDEITLVNGTISDDEDNLEDLLEEEEVKMTLDELISGALESAFWAMDKLILKDKEAGYRISGGSCALVSLFIFNKVYVANAGDCRACIYDPAQPLMLPMSFDFTPESDRQRIQMIAYQRPELLRHPITREKLYNRHVLSRKTRADEIGVNTVMYRDFYMAGWSCRDVTSEDVRLVPLISGRGKQCRLLGTVGVARGLGDHDLVVKSSLVNCKEFLSCQPEVRVKKIDELDPQSVMIMASDGLWDVMPNDKVYEIIKTADEDMHDGERAENFCQRLAKNLILEARGTQSHDGYWEKKNGELASGDDITCFVLPIKDVRDHLLKDL